MISESWSGEAKAWCEKLINRHLSFQFRENVQDVLPALPNPDDYFLLRWLRGEGRGGEVEDEGAARESGSSQLHHNPWLSGSDHTILFHMLRSRRVEGEAGAHQIPRVPHCFYLLGTKQRSPVPSSPSPVFPQLAALTCRNQRPCFAR